MSLAFLITSVSVYVYMCFNNFNDIINVVFYFMMLVIMFVSNVI